MFDRLETGDGPAEGVAVEGVVLGILQRFLRAADLLERQHDGGAVERCLQIAPAVREGAERLCRRAVEGEGGVRAGGVDGLDGLARDTGPGEVDQEQADFGAGVGDDDGEVGHVAIGHGRLGAGELAAGDVRPDVFRHERAIAFGRGEAADFRTVTKAGQVRLLLLRRAGNGDGLPRQVD